MDEERIIFNITSEIDKILKDTKPITYDSKQTDCYKFSDFYKAYKRIFGNQKIYNVFKALQKVEILSLFPSGIIGNSVLCRSYCVNKNLIYKILNRLDNSQNIKKYELASSSEDDTNYESQKFLSDQNLYIMNQPEHNINNNINNNNMVALSKSNIISKSIPSIKVNKSFDTTNKNNDNGINKKNTSNINKNNHKKDQKRSVQSVNDNVKKIKKDIYDHLESSSNEEFKIFKTPLEDNHLNDKILPSFEKIKEKIIEIFENSPVIPINSVNQAYCAIHGNMFNYRESPCNIPMHKHNNLTKYLQCCKSILEIKIFKSSYAINITPHIQSITKKRKQAFLEDQSTPKLKYFIEALLTTLFPTFVKIPLSDLIDIFNYIYSCDIDKITKGFKNFLLDFRSQNVYLLNKNDVFSVSINPLHNVKLYHDWMPSDIQDHIISMDRKITDGSSCPVVELQINIPSKDIFKVTGVDNLLRIADLNIPTFIQEISTDDIPTDIEYTSIWRFIQRSVNFDDKIDFLL